MTERSSEKEQVWPLLRVQEKGSCMCDLQRRWEVSVEQPRVLAIWEITLRDGQN